MPTSLEELVERALALLADAPDERRCVIGVVGAPGAGKSTLVERLVPALAAHRPDGTDGTDSTDEDWVVHLPMDGYHLADAQLDRLGRRDRKGAPDTFDVDGYTAVLERVRTDLARPVYLPGFERDLEQPIAAALVVLPAARIVVTEGTYLLHGADGWEQVAPLLDQCWYVDLPDDVRRGRLTRRHVRFGKSPEEAASWVERVDEPNARLVAQGRPRADLVIGA